MSARTMWWVIAMMGLLGGTWLIVIAHDAVGFFGGVALGVLGLAALRKGWRS